MIVRRKSITATVLFFARSAQSLHGQVSSAPSFLASHYDFLPFWLAYASTASNMIFTIAQSSGEMSFGTTIIP